MRKFMKLTLFLFTLFMLAACRPGADEITIDPGPVRPVQPHDAMIVPPADPTVPQQVTEPPAEPLGDYFPPSGYYFTLTPEEEAVFERLKTELSTDVFEGLSPISVMKIAVMAGITGEWRAEFAAFNYASVQEAGSSLEAWESLHGIDLQWADIASRRSMANWVFPRIDEGFVLERGNRAVVVFYTVPDPEELEIDPDFPGVLTTMNLIRNDRGIWEVMFRPHIMDDFVIELLNEHFGV